MSIINAVSATDGSYKPYNSQNTAPAVSDATTITVNNENPVNKVVAPVSKEQNIQYAKSDEKFVALQENSKTDPPPPIPQKSEAINEAIAKSRFDDAVTAEENINQEITIFTKKDDNATSLSSFEAGRAYSQISLTGEIQPEKFNPPVPVTEIKAPSMPLGYVSQNNLKIQSNSDETQSDLLKNKDSIIVDNSTSKTIELVTDKVTYNLSEKDSLNYGLVN